MRLSPFGKCLRKIQIDHGLKLKELAELLGISVSYLSSIQHGRKRIPEDLPEKIIDWLALDQNESANLRSSYNRSIEILNIEDMNGDEKEIVSFIRNRIPDLNEDEREFFLYVISGIGYLNNKEISRFKEYLVKKGASYSLPRAMATALDIEIEKQIVIGMLIQALPNLTFIECQTIESRLAEKGVPLRLKRANSAIQFSEGKMLRRKGMVVPYRTKSWLTVRARAVREKAGFADFRRIDVLGLVENFLEDYWPGSRFDVLPAAELGEVDAIAYPFESRIVVSEEIYLRAFHGDGHARFTIAHEIAHMLLHRVNMSGERHLLGPNETDSEWQADYFAAQLLVPEHMLGQLLEPNYIATEFGVSRAAATVALKQFSRRRKLAS